MKDQDRPMYLRQMDAIAGGLIGLLVFGVGFAFFCRKLSWFEVWQLWAVGLIGLLFGGIGSYLLGARFWDIIFDQTRRVKIVFFLLFLGLIWLARGFD